MKNVYFRPVLTSVESGVGDPYMIALDCVAELSGDLRIPLTTLIVSMITLFTLAIRSTRSVQSNSSSPANQKAETP